MKTWIFPTILITFDLLACECDGWCHSMLSPVKDGKCDLLEREGCYIWDAIQKAGGEEANGQ